MSIVTTELEAHAHCYGGTYRAMSPEDSWRRLVPFLAPAGITRVADVTLLDDIGIPVWQAIRPNSRNITVSQGKGISHALARISAAMEAFELHCAEESTSSTVRASAAQLGVRMGPLLAGLPLLPRHAFTADTVLDWHPVTEVSSGDQLWWPLRAITVDFSARTHWAPPIVRVNSNGLASGNTLAEAALHGLLELVERDALARALAARTTWASAARIADVSGSGTPVAVVADRIIAAGGVLEVMDITPPDIGLPAYVARVWSSSLPHWFSGSGCHPAAEIALARALTEAVQSRVTAIAGARDDIPQPRYDFTSPRPADCGLLTVSADDIPRGVANGPLGGPPRDLDADLETAVARCERAGARVLLADLTRPDYGIPVVRVAAPGLRFAERHGHGG